MHQELLFESCNLDYFEILFNHIKLKKIYFVAIKIPNKRWYDHKTAPSIYKNQSCKPRLWGSQKKKNLCAAIRQYIGTKPASIVRNCAKLGIRPRIYASISWKTNS